jgi:restriction system protein
VKWLKEIARTEFDQDLLYSLGAFMTVCQIQRNQAEMRIKALLTGQPQPTLPQNDLPGADDAAAQVDLQEYGRDQITAYISQKFKGHAMARLLEGILRAQGYTVYRSPEGADGGIDLLAGQGALGFAAPRLGVQVKSGDGQADVKVVRELQGVLKDFGADQGLFLSWGGFNKAAYTEARKRFFNIRLWDSKDFVDALLSVYEQLDPELQAELPLKRIWTLVSEKQDG